MRWRKRIDTGAAVAMVLTHRVILELMSFILLVEIFIRDQLEHNLTERIIVPCI
jgi:hypothetical protein